MKLAFQGQPQHPSYCAFGYSSFVYGNFTNSSAVVGWIPIESFISSYFNFIFTANENPYITSPALGPK